MLLPFIHKIAANEDLSATEAREAMLSHSERRGHYASNMRFPDGPADEG
jgi:hypothetical protein